MSKNSLKLIPCIAGAALMLIGGVSNAVIVCADSSYTLSFPGSKVKCTKGTLIHQRMCSEVIPVYNKLFNTRIANATYCGASTFNVGGTAVLRPGSPFLTAK